jgi:hypothetical protein
MTTERVIMLDTRYCDVFGVRGSAEDWRINVGELCRSNSRLLLALGAAAAGPLLTPMNEPSRGFHLNGAGQSGKSITTLVAGSFWGGSAQQSGYMRSWRATANGLEGIAAVHNDGFLVLDELGQTAAAEAPQIAYMLANGVGKIRAGRNGVAPPTLHWRLVFLSSGEMGLADKMAEIGRRTYAGLEVRMIDIPAMPGPGTACLRICMAAPTGRLLPIGLRPRHSVITALQYGFTPSCCRSYGATRAADSQTVCVNGAMNLLRNICRQVPGRRSVRCVTVLRCALPRAPW